MTLEDLIAYSIALTVIAWLLRFTVWVIWPRKIEHDPYAQPHGWEKR